MKITIEYKTNEEREDTLNANSGNYLIEEQNISEGNFLIFTTVKPLTEEVIELQKSQSEQDDLIMDIILGRL